MLLNSINYTYGYWCGVVDTKSNITFFSLFFFFDSISNNAILFTWNDILVIDFQTLGIVSNVSLTYDHYPFSSSFSNYYRLYYRVYCFFRTVTGGDAPEFAIWDPTNTYLFCSYFCVFNI
jgi:hypothetical protein